MDKYRRKNSNGNKQSGFHIRGSFSQKTSFFHVWKGDRGICDTKTGLNYLSIRGNEAEGVSVIITSDKDIETFSKLADEFQTYSVSSQWNYLYSL